MLTSFHLWFSWIFNILFYSDIKFPVLTTSSIQFLNLNPRLISCPKFQRLHGFLFTNHRLVLVPIVKWNSCSDSYLYFFSWFCKRVIPQKSGYIYIFPRVIRHPTHIDPFFWNQIRYSVPKFGDRNFSKICLSNPYFVFIERFKQKKISYIMIHWEKHIYY